MREDAGQERVVRLEERIAFLERHVESLDEVVREAHDRAEALAREVRRLQRTLGSRIDALEEGGGERGPEDDVPPHWGRGSPEGHR